MTDWVKEWKNIRSIVKTGNDDNDFDLSIKFILHKMNQEKFAKVSEFEALPVQVTIVSFDRVDGGKFVDKWGKVNRLVIRVGDEEKVLENTSYAFAKAYKDAGLVAGDVAMIFTVGFKDPVVARQYRFWIFQKLGEEVGTSGHSEQPK